MHLILPSCPSSLPEWKLHEHRGFSVPPVHYWSPAPRALPNTEQMLSKCAEWVMGHARLLPVLSNGFILPARVLLYAPPGSGCMKRHWGYCCFLSSIITLCIFSTEVITNWYFICSLSDCFPSSTPPHERRLFLSHAFITGCPGPRTVRHM